MRYLILMLVFGLLFVAAAQPDTLWANTFGESATDMGTSVQQTSDGGYIVSGSTLSSGSGGYDVWLIKTDGGGIEEWNQTFGGSFWDMGESVQETSDGGYIVAGYKWSSTAGQPDVWLIKTDASGTEEWNQTFGGSSDDRGYSVQQTSEGGYIVAGYTLSSGAGQSDVWLIKTDGSGTQEWTKTFGGSDSDEGYSVQQTYDGGYIVAGYTDSFGAGAGDIWLIKTDSSGIEEWNRTFGGSSDDRGCSVRQTADGGYIVVGKTESSGAGYSDVWLIKTDSSGIEEWNRTYGGIDWDFALSVVQTSDGGYIMVGDTYSSGAGAGDIWLIKTDTSGSEEWNQTFGGSSAEEGHSVAQTSDGGYIVAGYTESFGAGAGDIWLIKTEPEVGIEESQASTIGNLFLTVHPNPSTGPLNITYTLAEDGEVSLSFYDLAGHRVALLEDELQEEGIHSMQLGPDGLHTGIYFLKLESGSSVEMARIVICR